MLLSIANIVDIGVLGESKTLYLDSVCGWKSEINAGINIFLYIPSKTWNHVFFLTFLVSKKLSYSTGTLSCHAFIIIDIVCLVHNRTLRLICWCVKLKFPDLRTRSNINWKVKQKQYKLFTTWNTAKLDSLFIENLSSVFNFNVSNAS